MEVAAEPRGNLLASRHTLRRQPKGPYFRRGRDTKKVDEYDEGESGSEFPVKFK